MSEPRKRMAISPNARRGGNIDDRRGLRGLVGRVQARNHFGSLERAMRRGDQLRDRARYWNQTDPSVRGMAGDRVFNHTPRVGDTVGADPLDLETFNSRFMPSRPMARPRQGLRPGTTSTMGRR